VERSRLTTYTGPPVHEARRKGGDGPFPAGREKEENFYIYFGLCTCVEGSVGRELPCWVNEVGVCAWPIRGIEGSSSIDNSALIRSSRDCGWMEIGRDDNVLEAIVVPFSLIPLDNINSAAS
jgi:hypothetical protein